MKTVLIMRHAKSSWDDSGLADHDRPLNARGQRTSPRMARLLIDEDLVPDVIVCSSAVRARTTAEIIAAECGVPLEEESGLYAADAPFYLDYLRSRNKNARSAMLVGHNPAVEEVIAALTGEDEAMPTGAIAHIEMPIDRWKDVKGDGAGTLVKVWRPRELED
jgi:phosphohistidine phosphatase